MRAPYIDPSNPAMVAWFESAAREAEGALYYYGAEHDRIVAWPESMYDCSAYVCAAWRRTGILGHAVSAPRAVDIANMCEPVAMGQQAPGDAAFYESSPGAGVCHVTLVVSPPQGAGAHSAIVGANGGGSSTLGNDSNARVKYDTDYWLSGLLTYGRLREEHRRIGASDGSIFRALVACQKGAEVPTGALGIALETVYGSLLRRWGRA